MVDRPADAPLVEDFPAPMPLGCGPEPTVARLALPRAAGLVPVPTRPARVWCEIGFEFTTPKTCFIIYRAISRRDR